MTTPSLPEAAQAVIDRWDTPMWKDVPATGEFINALRSALAADRAATAPDADSLFSQIMNLPSNSDAMLGTYRIVYMAGHRDARHAAAELVSAALTAPDRAASPLAAPPAAAPTDLPPFYIGGPYHDGAYSVCELATGRILRLFRGEDDLRAAAGVKEVSAPAFGIRQFVTDVGVSPPAAAATPIAPEAEHGSVDPVEQISPPAAALGRAEGAWQPFATAPQDGTHVLAYFPRHPFNDDDHMDESIDLGGVQAVTWRNGSGWIEPDYMDATGAFFGDDCCYAPVPTHWMPLPEAPKDQQP
jgi:hypothetical protein